MDAYLVEIESLEENTWIHANIVYQIIEKGKTMPTV